MKRGNQMIKKLSVAVISMIALTTLGLSSAFALEQIDENVVLDMTIISVPAPNELTATEELIDENGVLEIAPVTSQNVLPIVVSDESYPFGV